MTTIQTHCPFNALFLRVKAGSDNKKYFWSKDSWWHHPNFPLNSEDLLFPAERTQVKFKDGASLLD